MSYFARLKKKDIKSAVDLTNERNTIYYYKSKWWQVCGAIVFNMENGRENEIFKDKPEELKISNVDESVAMQ